MTYVRAQFNSQGSQAELDVYQKKLNMEMVRFFQAMHSELHIHKIHKHFLLLVTLNYLNHLNEKTQLH